MQFVCRNCFFAVQSQVTHHRLWLVVSYNVKLLYWLGQILSGECQSISLEVCGQSFPTSSYILTNLRSEAWHRKSLGIQVIIIGDRSYHWVWDHRQFNTQNKHVTCGGFTEWWYLQFVLSILYLILRSVIGVVSLACEQGVFTSENDT